MIEILKAVHGFVWGLPALVMILGVGLYLSLRTGFIQLRLFPRAVKALGQKLRAPKTGGITPYQTLCTALAATVGTGNIAGVAGALALGGPGAIFWMWLCALLGMVTKFAEATLASHFQVEEDGQLRGGPMEIIRRGLPSSLRFLAGAYCFFGVVAAFGVGSATQVTAVLDGISGAVEALGGTVPGWLFPVLGLGMAVLTAALLLGGAKRIGAAAERLVPFAALGYVLLCLAVLGANLGRIGPAFEAIFRGAFSPRAVTGGLVGSVLTALRVGVSRGVFTNEAGLGTAAISYAGARVDHPAEQGLMGILEVFIDTVVICTLTALVILVSGVAIPYGTDPGAALTSQALAQSLGAWSAVPLALFLCCFAFATILGWGLYGARCAQYLFGSGAWRGFVLAQSASVALGALLGTGTVWLLADTLNGLMAIPNLVTLALLGPVVSRLGAQYTGGNKYEDFHQRKPLPALSHAQVPSPGRSGRTAG